MLTLNVHIGKIQIMKYAIEFSEEKNLLLKETRGICFEEVIKEIEKGRILDVLKNKNYPNQKILVIKIKNYIYVVPCVFNQKRENIFFKTVYPSRILAKKYLKKGEI